MADSPINSVKNSEVVVDKQGISYRRSIAHLPAFYRTDTNHRFLSSTVDQLIQPGKLERLDGFIGRDYSYTREATDSYIEASSNDRQNYQLEPTVTYTDKDTSSINPEDQVKFTGTYDDYINQIKYLGGNTSDHSRLNSEDVYAWNPAIDYDKLINYREYYWLPEGPNPITISTTGPNAVIDLIVSRNGKSGFVFQNLSNTELNPTITLYKGNTYKFHVDNPGHPFYIMTEPFKGGISVDGSTSLLYNNGVGNNGIDAGTLTFTIPSNAPDILHYQCGNHSAMHGIIKIQAVEETTKIDPEKEIIGTKNYTTHSNVKLSNGMKIKFGSNVIDTTLKPYANREFYVEGVGQSITLTDTTDLLPTGSYSSEVTELYDEVAYADRPYAVSFFRAETPDYITIKRSSIDGNSWSRYNRWFHKSVIEETATALGYTASLDQDSRAKRPIIEFDSGLILYNHGTKAKKSVSLVDTVTTDVFSEIVNKLGYVIDGVEIQEGMRILIANDKDPLINNKIYKVSFVKVQGQDVTSLNLTEDSDTNPIDGEAVTAEYGRNHQGKTFFYSSSTKKWQTGQNKTKLNQSPLFDLYDSNHVSFSNTTTYPNSTFSGATLFSYKTSDSAVLDSVLGLKVKYKTINNVGDILFTSDLATNSFDYNINNTIYTKSFKTGHTHVQNEYNKHRSQTNWKKLKAKSKQRVVRTFVVTPEEKVFFPIDFYKNSNSLVDLEVTVSVNNNVKKITSDFTLVNGTTNKYIKFNNALNVNDIVLVHASSSAKKIDGKGLYEIPENISINPLNEQISDFTYGQILYHLNDINEKNNEIIGQTPGSSNLRDLPGFRALGGSIIQHQSPLPQAVFSLIDENSNAIRAIEYCSREYQSFKENFLTFNVGTTYNQNAADRVDEILKGMAGEKNNSFPFFYEDMVGYGANVSTRTYTVNDPTIVDYAIDSLFDISKTSNRAVYLYKNDTQLLVGTDYTFSTTDDSVKILTTLSTGDVIKIKDYTDTTGSFIPPTPTKLGMYPKYKPEIIQDNTYIETKNVIVGHDGSKTIAYNDYRDDILLELEKRIYNNCKINHNNNLLKETDVRPSAFMSTSEYTTKEIDDIMSRDFFAWAGKNSVDYQKNNFYDNSNQFTWNYSQSKDTINEQFLPGHWRGIFKLFYDTDRPHIAPWEMLGYSEKPTWWEETYGPAPYTSGNTLLWTDLANGFDNSNNSANARFIRSNLLNYLPVDDTGALKSPVAIGLVSEYTYNGTTSKWKFGDQAPGETAWRRSSQYPFSIIKMLALTKPAKFFGNYLDNSRLIATVEGNLYNSETETIQTLKNVKYHLETITDTITGTTTRYSTAGYQPLVVNYLISQNLDPAKFFYDKMKNLNVQLGYKLGGFTDKDNLKILTDSISPGSTAGSQFIPEENYKLLFRSSNPVESYDYSGVLVELNSATGIDGSTLEGGYKVIGYNTAKPYFDVFLPVKNGKKYLLSSENEQVVAYQIFDNKKTIIPYGTVFKNKQEVVDFLLGYGKYLESRGFIFDKFSNELKEISNWELSAKEFLYWTTQGWAPGSAITLSPGADGFSLETNNSVINKLNDTTGEYSVLNSAGKKIPKSFISTKRIGNTFEMSTKGTLDGIYNVSMNAVQKEHILLFDNITVFSDIIFQLQTGFRQQRLKLIGWKTANWNGDYYAPGFVFDEAYVSMWTANTDYQIGDTVEYNAGFYVAKSNHNAGNEFTAEYWIKKDEKPAPQLIPNFDYKISQFNDFYNLETNNFDESQQGLAQHLIGYQSRTYLDNLFTNDISQYKFYQGFIKEKGTQNAINKLTKAKFYDENIDLNVYPEWMIKSGEFGNLNATQSLQISMPQNTFKNNIQSIEFTNNSLENLNWTKSARVNRNEFYSTPIEYEVANTFDYFDYNQEGYDRKTVQKFPVAGFPRLSDVQHTAFSINDLFNLDITQINNNDLVWIAKKQNNDWDVQRITFANLKIVAVRAVNDNTELEITFDKTHTFSVNDILAIKNSSRDTMNGIYAVSTIPANNKLTFAFDTPEQFISTDILADESTLSIFGLVYKFISVRISSMDNVNSLISYDEYRDDDVTNERPGDIVFVDNENSKWKIYEKTDPYSSNVLSSPTVSANQEFGHRIVSREDGRYIAVSAPQSGQGTVNFFVRRESNSTSTFNLTSSFTTTQGADNTTRLGDSLTMSSDENFVVAGAPQANIRHISDSSIYNDAGLISIYKWNTTTKVYEEQLTITPEQEGSTSIANWNFGWATALAEPIENSTLSTTPKYLFVTVPGHDLDTGSVFLYKWQNTDDSTSWTLTTTLTSTDADAGQRFGHSIAVNDNADIIAIGSKNPETAGKVEIFKRTSENTFIHRQTLTGVSADGSSNDTQFGDSLEMSSDGTTLIVSAPGIDDGVVANTGAVYYYKWNDQSSSETYTLKQTIKLPNTGINNVSFGSTVKINKTGDRLLIGAESFSTPTEMKFDFGATTFDLQDTAIVEKNRSSGATFTATKYDSEFVIDDKLTTTTLSSDDRFGSGLVINDNVILVGSSHDDALSTDGSTVQVDRGTVTVYDYKTKGSYAWKVLETESTLIDNRKIQSSFIFDSSTNKIIDYLNYYDPVKGRILGVADREINFKSEWDPATYNIESTEQLISVDRKQAWGEEHIGEVWWDLSKVRWIWYEQGSQEYKSKNWGRMFPNSSIDIYEWVESTLLPSEWSVRADTPAGLALGISGQPLDNNDQRVTLKQKYNPQSETFVNYYYYWVRNSVFLPELNKQVTERKNSTAYISRVIADPLSSGIKYFGITSSNSLVTLNVKNSLVLNNTVLNINYKNNLNDGDNHTVWKLFKEGDKLDRPTEEIERKWWDSLTGSDIYGNQIPDLSLPLSQRYGNSIRPRQSWYVNRLNAVQEIIQYTNSILTQYQIANSINYKNLDSQDPEPTSTSGEWDTAVDTYADLTYINTNDISGVLNVLVRSDEVNSKNLWAVYQWSGTEWNRNKVQTYKTSNYYSYVDWYASGYSVDSIIDQTVTYQYQLDTLSVDVGKIIKVTLADTGGWKLFVKTNTGWDNIATQNGTIQFSRALYDYTVEASGFAGLDTYDGNFFDDEPTIELRKILQALRDDIFIGDLLVEYNNIFFIGLRKVLEEQIYVDWLAKTSFINVTNFLRPLDQRKTYKIGTENYVESYINEVKPFHTKIREYKLGYTKLDTQQGTNTDFDLPAIYDGSVIRNLSLTNEADLTLLNSYPYNEWKNNYKKYVSSIRVINGGSGYITAPTITLVGGATTTTGPFQVNGLSLSGPTSGTSGYFYPAYTAVADANLADSQSGGTGLSDEFTFQEYPGIKFYIPQTGRSVSQASASSLYNTYATADTLQATARAVISGGKVTRIDVLTPGSNYTATPTVVITGGGTNNNTPSSSAKAYAVLKNDAVRDIETTIKFDRVQRTGNVLIWTKDTSYSVGDLLRYENDFYKVETAFTSSIKFSEGLNNLIKLRGDESYITAAERTLGLYAPQSGMPGNELSQVMTGVDYGGVMVTGLAFDKSQGWDVDDWYNQTWDTYGLAQSVRFYGDGSTIVFNFEMAPQPTDVYTVYFTDISDSTVGTGSIIAQANKKRVRQFKTVIRGDGSTTSFTIRGDDGLPASADTLIELIPFDSDGVLTPTDDDTLDSIVSGGNLKSVLGQSPSDIILEGDAFITPETSYAPEENLPGSIFDTVDIKVYTAPESGVPFVMQKNYIANGTTDTFDIGQYPGTQDSVIVSINGVVKRLGTDYTVDVGNKTITLNSTPNNGETISIRSFAISGVNYMVLDTFTGDGSTSSFSTSTRNDFESKEIQYNTSHTGDGSTKVFATSPDVSAPQYASDLTIFIDGVILDRVNGATINYTVDGTTSFVTLKDAPSDGASIIIRQSVSATTSQLYVTIDGTPTTNFTTTVNNKLITVDLHSGDGSTANPPASGKLVQIASFNKPSTSGRAYYELRTQSLTYDGSTVRLGLTYPPGAVGPYDSLTMVELDGKILRGPDNRYYIGDGSTSNFSYRGFSTSGLSVSSSGYETVSTGSKENISTLQTVVDSIPTSTYDGAWYLTVNKNIVSGDYETSVMSVTHNGTIAVISDAFRVNTGSSSHTTYSTGINGSNLEVYGTGSSDSNTSSFIRIGLGTSTSSSALGTESTITGSTTDSSTITFDSWNKSTYRGAKYFISVKNSSKSEYSNLEVLAVHNDVDAFVSEFNNVNTGSNDLVSVDADISGTDVRLRVTGHEPGLEIRAYRILLKHDEISDGTNNRGSVVIGSAEQTIDSFLITNYYAGFYVIVSKNTDTGESSIHQVNLIHNGSTNVYLNADPSITTSGGTNQLNFSSSITGNTLSLKASSNAGSNTSVSVYRFGVLISPSTSSINDLTKIKVYVNGRQKVLYSDYRINTATQSVEMLSVPLSTDSIAITTLIGNHYYNEGSDIILDPTQIATDGLSLTQNSTLTVTTFNNALGATQQREVFEGVYSGEFYLENTPTKSDYVFVWLNGETLVAGHDYLVEGNRIKIYSRNILLTDRIDVMYFKAVSAINAVGYRIFKDMLNRTFYKRISQTHTTKLSLPLDIGDETITVEEGSRLNPVDGSTLKPGVVFIDKERIEYFYKNGNVLGNLRRGTLGTGIKAHASGAKVVDAGAQQTVPYADAIHTKTYTGDGSTVTFTTTYAPSSASELDIFIGGQRLLITGEDGSTTNYTVDGSTASVTLSSAPASGTQVKILQKRGQVWYAQGENSASDGTGLQNATTIQAKFIDGEPTNAPE